METTIQLILIYIVMPVIGLGLILFALVRGKQFDQQQMNLGLKKLGLELKCDKTALLILMGFVLLFVGGMFIYYDYDEQIATLECRLNQTKAEIASKDELLERFNCYAMHFSLVFPQEDSVAIGDINVQAVISRQGEGQPQITTPDTRMGLSNDLWVHIDNLHPGDELRLLAYQSDGTEWQSNDICEVPKSRIMMVRAE